MSPPRYEGGSPIRGAGADIYSGVIFMYSDLEEHNRTEEGLLTGTLLIKMLRVSSLHVHDDKRRKSASAVVNDPQSDERLFLSPTSGKARASSESFPLFGEAVRGGELADDTQPRQTV